MLRDFTFDLFRSESSLMLSNSSFKTVATFKQCSIVIGVFYINFTVKFSWLFCKSFAALKTYLSEYFKTVLGCLRI